MHSFFSFFCSNHNRCCPMYCQDKEMLWKWRGLWNPDPLWYIIRVKNQFGHGFHGLSLINDRHFCSASRGIVRLGCHLCGLRPSKLSGHHRPGGDMRPGWLLLLDALVCFGVLCVFLGKKHLGPFWDQRPGTQRMAWRESCESSANFCGSFEVIWPCVESKPCRVDRKAEWLWPSWRIVRPLVAKMVMISFNQR